MVDTNGFSEEEINSNPTEDRDRLNSLPKLQNGAFDLESMTPEQKATYWEIKAKSSTRGFHSYKTKTDKEIDVLRQKGVIDQDHDDSQATDYRDAMREIGVTDDVSIRALERLGQVAESNAIKKITSNPSFVNSIAGSNMNRLNEAFAQIASEEGYEQIGKYKTEIIEKYFSDTMSIPEDVYSVLKPLAGSTLFEHRAELENDDKPKHDSIEMLGGNGGGDHKAPNKRDLNYWTRFAKEKPQEFANPEVQKQFNEDMAKIEAS